MPKQPKLIEPIEPVESVEPVDPVEPAAPHYVCTGGCGTVSPTPAKCSSPGCIRGRNPLTLCTCTDGTHGDLPTKNMPKD